eukprot:COSAG02_NODE_15112_length_1202_cov_11.757933_1_plen_73_part_01
MCKKKQRLEVARGVPCSSQSVFRTRSSTSTPNESNPATLPDTVRYADRTAAIGMSVYLYAGRADSLELAKVSV